MILFSYFFGRRRPKLPSLPRLAKDLKDRELKARLSEQGGYHCVAVTIPDGPYRGLDLVLPLFTGAVVLPIDR